MPKCTDPDTKKVYPATVGLVMTNISLGRGGPGCTVATWEKLTKIHIDHFMKIDFSGVVSMADAIGGVPVCVDANIYSKDSQGHGSGLKLKKGTTPVKGTQALAWLRTRYGFEDNTDIGRTKAQHQYMNSMVRQLRENATISNPGKLRSLAETATKALTVDKGLGSVLKLYDLGNELKKVEPKRITMTTMPWQWAVSDSNRVEPEPVEAEQLFRLVREDIALDGKDKKKTVTAVKASTDPAAADDQIGVTVQNGTRTAALGPVGGHRAHGVPAARRQGLHQGRGGLLGGDRRGDDGDPLPERRSAGRRPGGRQGAVEYAERGEEVDGRLGRHARGRRRLARGHGVQGEGAGQHDARRPRTCSTAPRPTPACTSTRTTPGRRKPHLAVGRSAESSWAPLDVERGPDLLMDEAQFAGSVEPRTAGRREAMTFFASAFGLVRKPKPHDMCMVARATGICRRAFRGSPLPAGSEPTPIAAR